MATLSVASDFRSLSRQPPADPDIHATLSDFLTYTEHFPSHLTRALTLIDDQRLRAERKIRTVHNATTTYSILPTLTGDKPDPVQLRKDISHALEEAERACRMAVEEAARLDETCVREARRLDVVTDKLKSQPLPPSRDPTPEQQALTSPNLKRERRMSVRKEDEKASRHLTDKAATKLRGRKIMVPGEVLPPPDPNAPLESISDWTSPRVSPPLEEPPVTATIEKKATPRPRSRTPKPSRSQAQVERERDRKAQKARGPRAPGQPGTNAHSAIAGISTSNALLALKPPPNDAVNGSKWLPWMKLTEWEMALLRKRMKKNAIWVPSQTMVRRELKTLGRGAAGREAAKADAQDGDTTFVDEHDEQDPTKVYVSGEETAQMNAMLGPQMYADDEDADAELINRGMRLNEAKKLKRQRMLEEQALQAQIARETGADVAPVAAAGTETTSVATTTTSHKKRKREATPPTAATGSVPTASGVAPDASDTPPKAGLVPGKKLKLSNSTSNTAASSKVPLAPAGVSSSPKSSSTAGPRHQHRTLRAATPPTRSRPTLVLKAGKAVSEEPPNRRASLRRGSNASLPTNSNGNLLTSPLRGSATTAGKGAGGRRSKRPAPGILTTSSGDGESAKVGVSKRKAAPKKMVAATKSSSMKTPTTTALLPSALEAPDEYIDPDEPRYCVCGDVSWGTMIACDNEEDCAKEWFHLRCVGLEELPPRRTKWYCPDCRKRVKGGVGKDGLVVGRSAGSGSGIGR